MEGSGTWTLSYLFAGVSVLSWDASYAVVSGGGWAVTIPAAATSLESGIYRWAAILTGGGTLTGQRTTPLTGTVMVLPNPETVEPGDLQPQAEKDLAAIDAVLSGRMTADLQAYSIGGRSVTLIPIIELRELRNQLRTELWQLRHPGQALPGFQIAFRQPGSSPA